MSGIIAVYALVVAVLIAGNLKPPPALEYSLFNAFMHLACGLSVGLTGMAAGYAIGQVGDTVCQSRRAETDGMEANLIPGCKSVHAAVENICRHGAYLNFWRGAGSIWVRSNTTQNAS